MKKRRLGITGIEMTELGYGCTAQFGKDFLGRPGIPEEKAYSLVSAALDSGIGFFDTGFNYGYAEERLGRCLSAIFAEGNRKRDEIVIQTKGGEVLNQDGTYGAHDYSADWIKKSLEISLKRLQLDYVDLFALHGARPEVLTDELMKLFEDLKSQGVIRAYGVSGISDEFGRWICEHKCFDYVMMTYNYAEARRNDLIRRLSANGIGVLSGGSLNRSLNTIRLIPKSRNDLWYLIRALGHYRKDVKRARQFDFVKNVEGMSPQQVSLAYILQNEGVTSASFNTTSIEHLKANVKAAGMTLPPELRNRIDKTGQQHGSGFDHFTAY